MTTIVSGTAGITFPDNTTQASAASGGGGLSWQAVITSNATVGVGNAYPVSTVSQPVVITLPASPGAGNTVQLTDYAGTWGANSVTINRNGSNIGGSAANVVMSISSGSVALVYIDSAKGWVAYNGFTSGSPIASYSATYLVAGGGGGGGGYPGGYAGGAGGAGGYLTGTNLFTPGALYTVTVGAGGTCPGASQTNGSNGASSSLGAIATSLGGGGGGGGNSGGYGLAGYNGGSGGGGGGGTSGGGNKGLGTAGQGYDGGNGGSGGYGGGGGGATGTGGNVTGGAYGTAGPGANSTISGSTVKYCNGGSDVTTAPANSGNGAPISGNGGSGVVIISYSGAQRAIGGTVTSAGGYTIHTFTSSGTYTA